ncbi:unnamed protein product [Nezara viridula]|uniref:Uncharacterized protein n=1 Tax=Nezara viridula TaxID=85310 RepID=A0A9P0H1W2_NEZVI|nr:unnamed protein product [Nezara viridula]
MVASSCRQLLPQKRHLRCRQAVAVIAAQRKFIVIGWANAPFAALLSALILRYKYFPRGGVNALIHHALSNCP